MAYINNALKTMNTRAKIAQIIILQAKSDFGDIH